MCRAAIEEIISCHRGNDDKLELKHPGGFRHTGGFFGVRRAGGAVLDRAEAAVARAGVAEDEEGRGAMAEAFAKVRTAGALAHGMDAAAGQLATQCFEMRPLRRGRPQPVRQSFFHSLPSPSSRRFSRALAPVIHASG